MVKGDLTYWRGKSFYINPSSRCTNDCLFCVRNYGDGVFGFDLMLDEDPTPDELVTAIDATWKPEFDDVAIVGFGEPLLNLDAVLAGIRKIKELSDVKVRMNTNGQGLLIHPTRDVPQELADTGLDRIQISLNAPDPDTYFQLCKPKMGRGTYESILEFAERSSSLMKVELSAVDIPGVDIEACRGLAERLGVGFRVRVFKGPEGAMDGILRTLTSS
ncbi:MAG: TatD family nuclease-associated radical SAM protein [Candidatus Thorarchaeota archaeon]